MYRIPNHTGALAGALAALLMLVALPLAAQTTDDNAVIARVVAIQGEASLPDGTAVQRGTALREGTRILADDAARVRIRFIGGSLVTLGAGADFEVVRYQPADQDRAQQAYFRLLEGAVLAVAEGITAGESEYTIETTAGSMGIRGTIVWGGYFIPGQADYVLFKDGPVALSNDFGEVLLTEPGQGTSVPIDDTGRALERPYDPVFWTPEKVFEATTTIAF